MKWTDTDTIAVALAQDHPKIDPRYVRFADLQRWVTELQGFDDDPERSGEQVLQAIQMAWIDAIT